MYHDSWLELLEYLLFDMQTRRWFIRWGYYVFKCRQRAQRYSSFSYLLDIDTVNLSCNCNVFFN